MATSPFPHGADPPVAAPLSFVRGVPLLAGIMCDRLGAADEAGACAALVAELRALQERMRNTTLAVLTAAASAAELTLSEAALEAGFPVIACVSMPRAADDGALAGSEETRYRSVLSRCASIVAAEGPETERHAAGRRLVAAYAHVLFALWDGSPPVRPDDTAAIARLRENGFDATGPDRAYRYDSDRMPVFQVVTPGLDASRPSDAFAVRRRYPSRYSGDRRAETDFNASLLLLDRYNQDLSNLAPRPDAGGGLHDALARTDFVANRLQAGTIRRLILLYGVSLAAVGAQIGFGRFVASEQLKIGTLLVAFIAYRVVRSTDLESRYQDYRTLAEAMRVQLAWNAGGLAREHVDAHYMRMLQSELQWIRMALRSASFLECYVRPPAADDRAAADWIRGQWRYYKRAANREQRRVRRYEAVKFGLRALAVVALLTAAALLLPLFHAGAWLASLGLKQWSTALAALFGAAAALLGSYADKRGFSVNAKRNDRMFGVFDRALRRLHHAAGGPPAARADIVYETGREALAEHAEWLMSRRERPLPSVNP